MLLQNIIQISLFQKNIISMNVCLDEDRRLTKNFPLSSASIFYPRNFSYIRFYSFICFSSISYLIRKRRNKNKENDWKTRWITGMLNRINKFHQVLNVFFILVFAWIDFARIPFLEYAPRWPVILHRPC